MNKRPTRLEPQNPIKSDGTRYLLALILNPVFCSVTARIPTRSGHPSPAESGGAGTERTLNYLDLLDALFTVAEQRISCINWCLTSLPESPRR